jgi:hypothetical protein
MPSGSQTLSRNQYAPILAGPEPYALVAAEANGNQLSARKRLLWSYFHWSGGWWLLGAVRGRSRKIHRVAFNPIESQHTLDSTELVSKLAPTTELPILTTGN